MTKEEAIEVLSRPLYMKSTPQDILDAHKMVIKALEQKPISETDIILTREEYGELVSSEYDNGYAKGYEEALDNVLDKIKEEIKHLDNANPSYGCYIDVVYREDVFEIIDEYKESEE